MFSSLGVTTHSSLATLVEKEYWGLVQSSTEVPEGANTMGEAAGVSLVILSIRVTSLKMVLGQGGSHGVGDHILMVL